VNSRIIELIGARSRAKAGAVAVEGGVNMDRLEQAEEILRELANTPCEQTKYTCMTHHEVKPCIADLARAYFAEERCRICGARMVVRSFRAYWVECEDGGLSHGTGPDGKTPEEAWRLWREMTGREP
jgi:hypothetical protein